MFDYFYGQSGEMFSYFRVPQILFRDIKFKDLSTDAKTLYGILLDRMGLSVKNGCHHYLFYPSPFQADNTVQTTLLQEELIDTTVH